MLTVGVDTYITIEQMNKYVTDYYPLTDSLRVQWQAMSEADQETYLRKAFRQMNSLPLTGRPIQELPFPRYPWDSAVDPININNAQAEIALNATNLVNNSEMQIRRKLQMSGVKSYRIGDLSETFVDGALQANLFGLPESAYVYLSKWLSGGYKICTSIRQHPGCK